MKQSVIPLFTFDNSCHSQFICFTPYLIFSRGLIIEYVLGRYEEPVGFWTEQLTDQQVKGAVEKHMKTSVCCFVVPF